MPLCRFNYSHWTASLNEIPQGQRGRLPPTDTRFRPDVRAIEEGRFVEVLLLPLLLLPWRMPRLLLLLPWILLWGCFVKVLPRLSLLLPWRHKALTGHGPSPQSISSIQCTRKPCWG